MPDDGATLLDRIILSAGRGERSIASVAQNVIVLEREEIEEALKSTIDTAELISRLVPGYAPDNQTISGASENFRGRSVLIMVDGVPRNTPLRNNSRILSLIDLNNVERIEVVNGASSLYGAGATGGTINFITQRGESETPTVTVTIGVSAHTANVGQSLAPLANVSIEGRRGDVDYFVSASGDLTRRSYDGNGNEMASDAMLGQGGGDRTGSGNLFGRAGYESGSRRIEVSADWTYANQEPDWFTDYTASPVAPDFSAPYTGEPLIEDSKYFSASYSDSDFALGALEAKAFYNDIRKQSPFTTLSNANPFVYFSGNPADPTSDANQSALYSKRAGLNLTVNTPVDFVSDGSELTWGVDYVFDNTSQQLVDGRDVISPMTQHQIAAFAQAEIVVTERLRLQGGARFEQIYLTVDDFMRPDGFTTAYAPLGFPQVILPEISVLGGSFDYNQFTFNAGAVFDVSDDMQAFANFSQGYSLTDIGAFTRRAGINIDSTNIDDLCDAYGVLFSPLGCTNPTDLTVSYGDFAPEPQLVNTYEGGLRGDWGDARGSLSAYLSTSDNGLTYDIGTNRVKQQKERIWGFEVTGEVDVTEKLMLGGVLGYQEGRFDADGDGTIGDDEYLPNNRIASTIKGSVYGTYLFDSGFSARGEVEFFGGRDRVAGETIDGAALVHMSVSKKFGNDSELSVAVHNLFDTDYLNPTATATRGVPVPGLGRAVMAKYKVTF